MSDDSNVLVNRLLDRFLGHIAYNLLFHLSTLEHQQGRDAADSIAHRRGAVTVHIHFADSYLAVVVLGQFVDDGSKGTTRPTPGRPEIDQNGLIRLQNILVKIRVCHFQNSVARHFSSDSAARCERRSGAAISQSGYMYRSTYWMLGSGRSRKGRVCPRV